MLNRTDRKQNPPQPSQSARQTTKQPTNQPTNPTVLFLLCALFDLIWGQNTLTGKLNNIRTTLACGWLLEIHWHWHWHWNYAAALFAISPSKRKYIKKSLDPKLGLKVCKVITICLLRVNLDETIIVTHFGDLIGIQTGRGWSALGWVVFRYIRVTQMD